MLEFIVEQLIALIEPLQNMSKDKRELKDNALKEISHALNETYIYYNGLSKGKPRNEDTERQLSKYWAAAAIPLRHLNQELAMICEYKADYWVNTEKWSEEQIHEHGIALYGVRNRYRKLLAPTLKRPRIEPTIT